MRALFAFYLCIFKSLRHHKIDTFLNFLNIGANQLISVVFLYVIINSVTSLKGFNRYELVLLYGVFTFNKGVANFFTKSLYEIEDQIRSGAFDGLLVRPVNPIIQILGLNLDLGELVNIVLGSAIIVIVLPLVKVNFVLLDFFVLLFFLIQSVIVFFSIRLICMSISFWTLTSYPIAIAVDNISEFAKYPISIYNTGIKIVLEYIIPFSVISYSPILVLLKKKIIYAFISFIISMFLLLLSIITWKKGLSHYKSSGH